jgi:hypothetical protein
MPGNRLELMLGFAGAVAAKLKKNDLENVSYGAGRELQSTAYSRDCYSFDVIVVEWVIERLSASHLIEKCIE